MRQRPDLFNDKQIELIMGNIEEIYDLQQSFFQLLKLSIDESNPHESLVGKCFLLYVRINSQAKKKNLFFVCFL